MIKWLFFDIGSTLVDETLCEEYRIDESIKNSNISKEVFKSEMIELCKENKDGYKLTCKKYNLPITPWPSFKERDINGVKDVLDYYYNKYNLGIIANQPLGTIDRLKARGLDKYFKVIMSSAEEGVSKPDEEIFLRALRYANTTAIESIMIGDRIDNDMFPAIKLGFNTIWIKRSYGGMGDENLLPKKPNYIINDIREMINLDLENKPLTK